MLTALHLRVKQHILLRWRGLATNWAIPKMSIGRHRSFNVANPAIARIEAMIQKRMTIVGSSQPFCSK